MGSSVTAGHDSPFNVSFPILTGNYMASSLASAGLTVESRNAAMGNNPCIPYDACIKTFAGVDVDIIHWEQTFNCFSDNSDHHLMFEQFIRQSMALPSRPVVVFASSDTPNWKESDCTKVNASTSYSLSEEENKMLVILDSDPVRVVSDLNSEQPFLQTWKSLHTIFKAYRMAGIQIWHHSQYTEFKCRGPYVPSWQCCAAAW